MLTIQNKKQKKLFVYLTYFTTLLLTKNTENVFKSSELLFFVKNQSSSMPINEVQKRFSRK